MDNTGTMSRPLVAGAFAVNVAVVATGLLGHPDQLWQRSLSALTEIVLPLVSLAFMISALVMTKVRTPGFVVGPGPAFVAPADRAHGYFVAGQVLLAAWVTRSPSLFQGAPYADPVTVTMRAIMIGSAVVVTVLNLVLVGIALFGRPRLELTPDGVYLGNPFWRRAVRWDELVPGLPLRQPDQDALTLTTVRPGRPAMRLTLNYIRVHTWFLADAIRYYVDHPDRRAEIGTQAGYDRLMTALGAAPVLRES